MIFLDIDGVLVTWSSMDFPRITVPASRPGVNFAAADQSCCEVLRSIVQRTAAAIVLSSSWRGKEVDQWTREVFDAWGIPDLTPVSVTPRMHTIRGADIWTWKVRNHHVGPFVILDDDSDMGALSDRLVRTTMEDGLTSALADEAVTHLSTPCVQETS